jgi:hypothetical protein
VSDANEKPIALACPFCGSQPKLSGAAGRAWCSGEDSRCPMAGLDLDLEDWNRRHNPYGNTPLASTLAAYLSGDGSVSLDAARDICVELDLWERAEGELDRALTREDMERCGFVNRRNEKPYFDYQDELPDHLGLTVSFPSNGGATWVEIFNNHAAVGVTIRTLRQFLALCALFEISPST